MSLAAALANATRPNVRRTRLDDIWDALDQDDRATLLAILTDPTIAHRAVARILTLEGHPIGKTAIYEARQDGWAKNKETS